MQGKQEETEKNLKLMVEWDQLPFHGQPGAEQGGSGRDLVYATEAEVRSRRVQMGKRKEIVENLTNIIFDPNDIRLAACTKPFSEESLEIKSWNNISKVSYPDTIKTLEAIQKDLLNHHVKYSEWNRFLTMNCGEKVRDLTLDTKKELKSWPEIIFDMFKESEFELPNARALKELLQIGTEDGKLLLPVVLKITSSAKAIKGIHTMPMIRGHLISLLAGSNVPLNIPPSYTFDGYDGLESYLKDNISSDFIVHKSR